jgi:methionyl-tRNA formyltransferase/ribosomal protein S18 acetylase RimI-like enzyme
MRVLIFGDTYGVPQLLRYLPGGTVVGIVGAEIRPKYFEPLKEMAAAGHVPFIVQPRHNSGGYAEFVKRLAALQPDFIIVNSYSMKLHPEVLALARRAAVNIHGALLPQYRGANPIQWALLNNETETGVTMHYMTAEFDRGDIIAQRRVPIYFEDTWRDVQARISVASEALLAEELPKLLNGTNARQPQDEAQARYYKRRHPEDGQIDWQDSVLHIYNLVRALVKPHPGAFYYNGPNKVVLDDYLTVPQVTALKYGPAGGRQMLKSAHVALTPLTLDDLPVMFEWINNREQVPFNAPYKPVHEDRHRTWFEAIQQRNDLLIFGIRLLETDKPIGLCQLHSINWVHRSAELQIRLGDAVEHGHGYGTEAVRLLLDFAFKDLNLRRVHLHVFSTNTAAIRVYEKVGFVREGVLRKAAYVDGEYLDVVVMRSEF